MPHALRRLLRWLPLLPALLTLAACGFQLRGSQPLPANLTRVVIQVPTEERALVPPLRQALEARGARVEETRRPGSSLLKVDKAGFDQRTLTLAPDGTAREYELFYDVTFRLQEPNGTMGPVRRVSVLRDYSYDDTRVLGKEAESLLLQAEMRREAAARIVVQLTHLTP